MPKCKNCSTKKYFRGSEKSPTGKGKCGMCENLGTKSKGKDSKKWVVSKRKTGKYWKRLSSKVKKKVSFKKTKTKRKSRTPKKKTVTRRRKSSRLQKSQPKKQSKIQTELSKDTFLYMTRFLDDASLMNHCIVNPDYARFCLNNQTRILNNRYTKSYNAKQFYPKWNKVELQYKEVILEGKYINLVVKKVPSTSRIVVRFRPKPVASFEERLKNQANLDKYIDQTVDMLTQSGLKPVKGGFELNHIIPRLHFNILLINASELGYQ